ncbi:hypothetical protein GCM10020254_68110 [Streptomyces goshikiensis]
MCGEGGGTPSPYVQGKGKGEVMERETGRVEAFSDGVFAIIITILVLELKVPEETGSHFWQGVREQWPHYAAYVVSFLIIGVMWVNHHTIFSHLRRVDRPLLFLNLLVLMVVSVIPYTTNVLAEHLMEEGGSANAAAVLYSGVTVAYALAFLGFWWYVTRVGHLFNEKGGQGRRPSHPGPLRPRRHRLPAHGPPGLRLRTAHSCRTLPDRDLLCGEPDPHPPSW